MGWETPVDRQTKLKALPSLVLRTWLVIIRNEEFSPMAWSCNHCALRSLKLPNYGHLSWYPVSGAEFFPGREGGTQARIAP